MVHDEPDSNGQCLQKSTFHAGCTPYEFHTCRRDVERVSEQWFSARVRDDEGPLTGRIIELASAYIRLPERVDDLLGLESLAWHDLTS